MKKNTSRLSTLILLLLSVSAFGQSSFITTRAEIVSATVDKANAITNDGTNLYVTGQNGSNWMVKKYNQSTMLPVAGFSFSALGEGLDIEYSAYSGGSLYVCGYNNSNQGVVYRLNATTGAILNSQLIDGDNVRFNSLSINTSVNLDYNGITIIGSFDNYMEHLPSNLFIEENLNANGLVSSIFIAKFNRDLTTLNWLNPVTGNDSYANASALSIARVTISSIDYCYITGYFGRKDCPTGSGSINFGTTNLLSLGGTDIFLAKFTNHNTNGPVFLWAKKGGGSFTSSNPHSSLNFADVGRAITVDATGNAYITGQMRGSGTLGTLPALVCNTPSENRFGFIAKYSSAGSEQWLSMMGACESNNSEETSGRGIHLDGTNLFVTGSSRYLTGSNSNGIYIGKYTTSTGTSIWHSVPTGGSVTTADIRMGTDITRIGCSFFVCGQFINTVNFGNQTYNSNSSPDVFVSKLARFASFLGFTSGSNCTSSGFTLSASGGGTYLWSTGATSSSLNIAVPPLIPTTYTVTVTGSGCAQQFNQTFNYSQPANAGPDKILGGACCPACLTIGTVLSGSPSYLWNTPVNGLCSGGSIAIPQISVDGIGTYTVYVTYPGCPQTADAAEIVSAPLGYACCRLSGIENEPNELENLVIVPNPSNGQFQLRFPLESSDLAKIIVTDATGKTVKQLDATENNAEINLDNFNGGIYFIEVTTSTGKYKSKISIQK